MIADDLQYIRPTISMQFVILGAYIPYSLQCCIDNECYAITKDLDRLDGPAERPCKCDSGAKKFTNASKVSVW